MHTSSWTAAAGHLQGRVAGALNPNIGCRLSTAPSLRDGHQPCALLQLAEHVSLHLRRVRRQHRKRFRRQPRLRSGAGAAGGATRCGAVAAGGRGAWSLSSAGALLSGALPLSTACAAGSAGNPLCQGEEGAPTERERCDYRRR